MATNTIVTAKVAKVIGDREVAFNKGTNAGVEVGDFVTINDRVEITDPDTKESLGIVLVARLRLTVTMAAERYCVARVTSRASQRKPGAWSARRGVAPLLGVTDNVFEEGETIALVKVGEAAVVQRVVADEDDPPF